MSENTKQMYREHLVHAIERLEEVMVLAHDAADELSRISADESLRLDSRKFVILSQVTRQLEGTADTILALRDLRKRDGEFHERA